MGSEWETVRLGDYINSCLGKMLDKNKNQGELHPYLGNKNVRWGGFDLDNLAQMKFLDTEHEKYGLQYGDLVVCEGGEPGRCAIWKDEVPDMKIQKALHRIRPHQELDSVYLHYWFCYAGKYELLDPYFTGTTIKHLTGKALSELPVPLPPIPEQKAIAHILGSLDDKIELNRRMNATLEGMAQALFQSWFVDFDPVLDNALAADNPIPDELADRAAVRRQALDNGTANREAAKHFPATFQLTEELGWIPDGWMKRTVEEVCDVIVDCPHSTPKWTESGVMVIRTTNFKDGMLDFNEIRYTDEEHYKKRIARAVPVAGDVILTREAPMGLAAIIPKGVRLCMGQRMVLLRVNPKELCNIVLYHMLLSPLVQHQISWNEGTGSTVSNIRIPVLRSLSFAVPQVESQYEMIASLQDLEERRHQNNAESQTLSELRDTLLPQLISGELRIPNAAKLADEVLA